MSTPARTTQLPALDIGKALYELFNEVIIATANLSIAKSLLEASKNRPATMEASGSFFSLTIHAHIESAQLYAAKLFDEHDDCASIPWLLKQARNRSDEFKNRPAAELQEAIEEAEQTRIMLTPVLTTLKNRRDRWLAHLDRKTVRDPAQFARDSELTYPELDGLFTLAAHILNTMADLHGVPGFIIDGRDYDDFSHTLDLIEKGIQANAQELDRRIGPCPDLSGSF
jgi:hypothetical protein